MSKNVLILVGPICAGKGEVGKILQSQFGYAFYSTSDTLRKIVLQLYGNTDRKNMESHANHLRKTIGHHALAQLTADLADLDPSERIIIDAVRHPGEITYLRQRYPHTTVLVISASQEIRFQRLKQRNRPGDPQTLAEFIETDNREMYGTGEPYAIKYIDCIQMGDYQITNETTSADLVENLRQFLQSISNNKLKN